MVFQFHHYGLAIPSRWYKPRRHSSQAQQGVGSNPLPQGLPSTRWSYPKSIPPDHFPLFAKPSSMNHRMLRGRLPRANITKRIRTQTESKENKNGIKTEFEKPANRVQSKPSATNVQLTKIPLATLTKGNAPSRPLHALCENAFNKSPPLNILDRMHHVNRLTDGYNVLPDRTSAYYPTTSITICGLAVRIRCRSTLNMP